MRYIEDVDTGEIFPVPDDIEENVDIPAFVKDDFPELKVNYSGEGGVNDIIADLSHQLIDEKNSKTVYHNFPIMKILCAVIIFAVVVVVCVFGVRFAASVNFEPITIEYTDSSVLQNNEEFEQQEESESQNENTDDEEHNGFQELLSELIDFLFPLAGVLITIWGIKKGVSFIRISNRGY